MLFYLQVMKFRSAVPISRDSVSCCLIHPVRIFCNTKQFQDPNKEYFENKIELKVLVGEICMHLEYYLNYN
jgi:hypothetical protein